MNNYAVVEDNIVINVCIWDGHAEFKLEPGILLVKIPEDSMAWIGWGYDEGLGFIEPYTPNDEESIEDSEITTKI